MPPETQLEPGTAEANLALVKELRTHLKEFGDLDKSTTFSVSSRILEELGSRLVGNAATALAELVKNSFDADAYHVEIQLQPGNQDLIVVRDSGHGMTEDDFKTRWAQLGSSHKREQGRSDKGRVLTGSKGVGRISAQFLSKELKLETIHKDSPKKKLMAYLNWDKAIATGDLVKVKIDYDVVEAGPQDYPGTTIYLQGLKQEWTQSEVVKLAEMLWRLEPPYEKERLKQPPTKDEIPDFKARRKDDFHLFFTSPFPDATAEFEKKRLAVIGLWKAELTGMITKSGAVIRLAFKGEKPQELKLDPPKNAKAAIADATFHVRIFDLQGRQAGVPVEEARSYLRQFGGVQIYDAGFRLPHYGSQDNDWLLIAEDQARRLANSSLLPAKLKQYPEAMQLLPAYWSVYGSVEFSTVREQNLDILITRDRLIEGPAFETIRSTIRTAIHYYANEKRRRELAKPAAVEVAPIKAARDVESALAAVKNDLPKQSFKKLKSVVTNMQVAIRKEATYTTEHLAAMSALATAGVAALAYQHEVDKQLLNLETIVAKLEKIPGLPAKQLAEIKADIADWTERTRALKAVFAHLQESENLEKVKRFQAREVVNEVVKAIERPLRGLKVDNQLEPDLKLPAATFVEWVSVLQNIFFNAANAVQPDLEPKVRVWSDTRGREAKLIVEDNGRGIDLKKADSYFEPFVRGSDLEPWRKAQGYGGTGLGLTIVRLIAQRHSCTVGFQKPSPGYRTAFYLRWEERA